MNSGRLVAKNHEFPLTAVNYSIIISRYVYIELSVSGYNVIAIYSKSLHWRCTKLANIKSAKKRILVTAVRTERNKAIRSEVKTCIKKVEAAVANNDKAAAQEALVLATKKIEMAATKGVYHKNNAARKISRLAKAVAKIA